MEDLKPCPFCGGKAAVKQTAVQIMETNRDSVRFDFRIECVNCHATAPGANGYISANLSRDGKFNVWHDDRITAEASWNMRADEKQPEPEATKKEYYHGFCSRCGRPVIAEKEEAFWWPGGTTDDHLCIRCDACGGLAEVQEE